MIKVLDSFIADKIAAGEVIERPLSIVKELIENSIDASADNVIIEIKNGGKSYIRITDNGSGIPSDEIEIAFLRHATGKISSISDLDSIGTLGFRGEALASIAAVSRLTAVSRTKDEDYGTRLNLHAGKLVSRSSVGANVGTTIIVEDVFYNLPARRKFLSSDARESAAITELVQKLAIFYSDVRFTLINNGKTILASSGDGNCLKTIQSIYPTKEFSKLIELKGESVKGFISDPGTTKNNRKGQIFFVNGRVVDSKTIEKGIARGYGDRIFSGYPICILFLELSAEDLDVNIHPAKREIKFLHEDEIVALISSTIEKAMNMEESIPSYKIPNGKTISVNDNVKQSFNEASKDSAGGILSAEEKPNKNAKKEDVQLGIREFLSSIDNCNNQRIASGAEKVTYSPSEEESHSSHAANQTDSTSEIEVDKCSSKPFDFEDLELCGYFFNAYILMQTRDALFVLDQHAAHERIYYEKLVNQYNEKNHASQPILTPVLIQTSKDVYNYERSWMDALERIGFEIDDFGADSFIIRAIPNFMILSEAESFAKNYIENASEYDGDAYNDIVISKLISNSCKAAVKANDRLSEGEIRELLSLLSKCSNPFSCPHGRPTFIKLTKYEIERSFKRK